MAVVAEAIVDARYTLMLLAIATNVASAAYVLIAIYRVRAFKRQIAVTSAFRPAVTVLKPVCGVDVDLYENLRTFFLQDYPVYQIVFGVRDATDPAIPIIQRLMAEFVDVDVALTVDSRVAGVNLKASNLDNMYQLAKHDFLVIADSDMRVDANYLTTITAPFADAETGVVTCLYKGTSKKGLPSLLASMFINEWFFPSVLVSTNIREIRYCFGATIAVRRHVLAAIGGFKVLSQYLADDHMLGRLAAAHGFKIKLSGYVVENVVLEKTFKHLFQHELRWARTVRTVEPVGHAFSFIMYGVPLAFLGALIVDLTFDWDWFEVALIAVAVSLRVWMHYAVRQKLGLPRDYSMWLVPLRDIFSLIVWGVSLVGRRVEWRGESFTTVGNGLLAVAKERQPS